MITGKGESTMPVYLETHPPVQRQYRERGDKPSGVIVVHTAENAPDLDGSDGSAEAVARFIQGRSDYGSYHTVVDRDSLVRLVNYNNRAYGDGTGSNSHAIHISAASQAHRWGSMTPIQRRAYAKNMAKAAADAAKWLRREHGIEVPPIRINRAQSDARVPGFITHAERDPARRSDPGAGFPWKVFFAHYRRLMQPGPVKVIKKGPKTLTWDSIWEAANRIVKGSKNQSLPRVKAARRVRTIAARYSNEH